MKFNFLSKNLPAFGLDVSSDSFKIMQMGKNGKEFSIKSFSEVGMPKGGVVGDIISDTKTFNFLLKQALQKPQYGKIDTNWVIASLPESKSFVRVIQIPKMSLAEAENAVPYEAESFIPMPIDQVYLDWQKISETGDKMNILMIASPREFVDQYLDILDKAGLRPAALEVESQSCHRAVVSAENQETLLLIDIEAVRTSLVMVEQGSLQFTSTIPIAGGSFTESIAKTLGVASAKAEEIKKRVGIANTNEYPNIKTSLLPVLTTLSAEIKNILKFHNEHSTQTASRVVLSGGGSKLKNLCEFLVPQLQETGVTVVELADPLKNLGLEKNSPINQENALSLVTVMGLAARGAEYEIN